MIRAYYKEAYPHEQDQDQHSPLQRLWLLRERLPRKALSFSGHINDKGYDTVQVDDSLCVACGTCYRVCPDSCL